jgi:hypothetical protein
VERRRRGGEGDRGPNWGVRVNHSLMSRGEFAYNSWPMQPNTLNIGWSYNISVYGEGRGDMVSRKLKIIWHWHKLWVFPFRRNAGLINQGSQ